MGLITSEQISKEQIQKRKNFALQALTNALNGKWAEWMEKADKSNRYNKYNSRLELLKSADAFSMPTLAAIIYGTANTVIKEPTNREDYRIYERALNQASMELFLRSIFGSIKDCIDERFMNITELLFYLININATDDEIEEYTTHLKNQEDIHLKDINFMYLLNTWYGTDMEGEIYQEFHNFYVQKIMSPKSFDTIGMDKINQYFTELSEAYRFWSFMFDKMRDFNEGDVKSNGEFFHFKNNYRPYFVPTQKGKECDIIDNDDLRRKAVASGLSAFVDLSTLSCTVLDPPFPNHAEINKEFFERKTEGLRKTI